MQPARQSAIIAIDLLRFASAMLVVLFHYGSAFSRAPGGFSAVTLRGLSIPDSATPFAWFGWVGVELFFVISGFVIALSAEGTSRSLFLRRRALRLLPVAWICATMTFLILTITAPGSGLIHAWLSSICFWPIGTQIDPSYWTLGIELCFYLLIATGLSGAGRPEAIERRGKILGAVSAAFWLFVLVSGPAAGPLMLDRAVQLALLPHGCFFALGVLALAMHREGGSRGRSAFFALFFVTALIEIVARSIERTHSLGIVATPWLPIGVFTSGLIVVLAAKRLQTSLVRHIDVRLATTLGLMTYPLYLIHQEVGAEIIALLMHRGLPFFPSAALALTTVLGFSWWVVRIAEPVLRARLANLIDAVVGFSSRRVPARDIRPSASPPAG